MAISTPLVPTWQHPIARGLLVVIAGTAVWVVAGTIGHLTSSPTGGLAAVYLPVALLTGFMIRIPQFRVQFALAALLGTCLIHLASGSSPVVPALTTAATLAEALIVASAMRATGAASLSRPRDGLIFGLVALAGCVAGGLLGAGVFAATNSGPALHKFATWVPADLLGMLLVVPLVVRARRPHTDLRRITGFAGLLMLASGVALLTVTHGDVGVWSTFLGWYTVLLILLVVGARYGVAALGVVQVVPAILVFIAVAEQAPQQWFERQVLAIALSWSLLVAVLAIRAELRSRHSSELLAADLFHHSPTPTAVVAERDGRLSVEQTNAAWGSLLSQDALLEVLTPSDPRDLRVALPRDGAHSAELRTKDGHVLQMTISSILRRPGDDEHYLVSVADITGDREQEARLRHAARTDPLTGLANRRAVFDELVARADDARTAVLYIDLDGFKEVNDTHGHPVGDALLVEVAALLTSGFRAQDTVARIGGDEFVVIADLGEHADLAAMCGRAEELVTSRLHIGLLTLRVRASVGAVTVAPGELPEQSLARADAAMYRRKVAQRRH